MVQYKENFRQFLSKFIVVILLIFLILFSASCSADSTYCNQTYRYQFDAGRNGTVSGNDEATIVRLSDRVTAAIYASDATEYADAYYLSIYDADELNLHSGAFDANYNNTLFVSQLVDYLFSGSEYGISPYALRVSGLNGYDAWREEFSSDSDSVCGSVYVTVQHSDSYIIVIYLFDSYENRHQYDKTVDRFINSFQFYSDLEDTCSQ